MSPPGSGSEAVVRTGGSTYRQISNALGNFPRVPIDAGESVAVEFTFPEAHENDPVSIEVQDGGVLDGDAKGQVVRLDAAKTGRFRLQADTQEGIYRVAVAHGSKRRVFQFWVGPDPSRDVE